MNTAALVPATVNDELSSRAVRVARGFAAAIVSVVVAATSHAAGGGEFPSAIVLLFGIVTATVIGTALAGRGVSWARLGVVVAASQWLFHTLFGWASASAVPLLGRVSADAAPTSHPHEGAAIDAAIGAASAHSSHLDPSLDPRMFAAHIAAAVVTLIALWLGESAFWAIVAVARESISCVRRMFEHRPLPERAPALRVEARPWFAQLPQVMLLAMRYRGPPSVAA